MQMRALKIWVLAIVVILITGISSYAAEPSAVQMESQDQQTMDAATDGQGNDDIALTQDNDNVSMQNNIQNIPSIQSIDITNIDRANGTFRVYLSNIQNGDLIRNVQVPLWSKEKGQDDLIWYMAQKDNTDNFYVDINIRNHKYSVGQYVIHVYITDTQGIKRFGGGKSYDLNVVSGTLTITEQSGTNYKVVLSGMDVPSGVRQVRFPVWSREKGQDDLKWYVAQQNTSGDYEAIINIKNHKSLGTYDIHAYAALKSGKDFFLGGTSFDIDVPNPSEYKIVSKDVEKGTFRISITFPNQDLIKDVKIPVWSGRNGQDDLIWYKAIEDSNGSYHVDVDISKHKYTLGKYIAHVYITDILGNLRFLTGLTENMEATNGSFQCTKEDEKQYVIELRDLVIPGGCKEVQFPVWSEVRGQDDLKWYTAKKDADGVYRCKINTAKHTGLGKFQVHAYAKMKNNSMQFIGGTGFETEAPAIGNITIDTTEKAKGKFQIKVTGVTNSHLMREMRIPVWSAANQSDLVWYTAIRNENGEYVVNVNISNHQYNCALYQIHVYVTDITGVQSFYTGTSCNMKPQYAEDGFTAENLDNAEKVYRIHLKGLAVPFGERSVRFAVWGNQNEQNDLRWYTASKQADGEYSCDIPIINHKEFGKYSVHAYCSTSYKSNIFIGGISFELVNRPQAQIQVSDIDGTKGTFKITLTNVSSTSGISSVQVPIWVEANQNDLKWYTASKVDETTYEVNVKASNHKHHFGEYKIHVYATMGNGINLFASNSTAEIQPINYLFSLPISSTRTEVGIKGCTATRVQLPTWSNAGGQDDVIWYNAVNRGNGTWSVYVDSINHRHAGNYITHVYADIDGIQQFMGQISYSMQRIPPEQELMYLKANGYSSPTGYLILVNCATHKVGVFQGYQGNWNCVQFWDCTDGAPGTPTVRGVFSVGSRGQYFDAYGCRQYWWTQFYGAYLFHSVIYSKQGQLVDGRLGMSLSHGCIRLGIGEAKWIYDYIPSGTKVVVY